MTVNKLPSWVKHMLQNLSGYQALTFSSKQSMPDDLFWMQNDSFLHLITALEDIEEDEKL